MRRGWKEEEERYEQGNVGKKLRKGRKGRYGKNKGKIFMKKEEC